MSQALSAGGAVEGTSTTTRGERTTTRAEHRAVRRLPRQQVSCQLQAPLDTIKHSEESAPPPEQSTTTSTSTTTGERTTTRAEHRAVRWLPRQQVSCQLQAPLDTFRKAARPSCVLPPPKDDDGVQVCGQPLRRCLL